MIVTINSKYTLNKLEEIKASLTLLKLNCIEFNNFIANKKITKLLVLPQHLEFEMPFNQAELTNHQEYQKALHELTANPIVQKITLLNSYYPIVAREQHDIANYGFSYNGIEFCQEGHIIFAGLNTVDNQQNVELTYKKLQQLNLTCARMGVYKPRTNPYSFQGVGSECLPYVLELAGKYGIKVVAMEITCKSQIDTIHNILTQLGNPCGVMLQIGTRNTQNFELLKAVGSQRTYPILLKRGFGISLTESLCSAEYLAKSGNNNIVFCLRGMKSNFSYPHRNFIDFAKIPTLKRLTKMPICVDPSHATGSKDFDQNQIMDLVHANAQGIIAGANMSLVDVHPTPDLALVDKKQTLNFQELENLALDSKLVRSAYLERKKLYCD